MKTYRQWAEEIRDPEIKARYFRAIKKENKQHRLDEKNAATMQNMISGSFTWSSSQEGHSFWYNFSWHPEKSFEDLKEKIHVNNRDRITPKETIIDNYQIF